MEEWIQLILFIVFGAVALLARLLSRRGSKEEPDIVLEEAEVTLPPWGNLSMEVDAPLPQPIEHAPPVRPVAPRTAQKDTRSQSTPESPTESSPPTVPTILGIPLSPQTFRQGIILAEILRPPKSLREPRQ